jgi:hypothetical protein
METIYLLGIAYLYANDASRAAIEFATVYQQSPELAPRAREQLSAIYRATSPASQTSFDAFVASLQSRTDITVGRLSNSTHVPTPSSIERRKPNVNSALRTPLLITSLTLPICNTDNRFNF